MANADAVLLGSGWQETELKYKSWKANGTDEGYITDGVNELDVSNGSNGHYRLEPKLPNTASKCTFQPGVSVYSDSPHRHLKRPSDRPKLKILPNVLHAIGETPLVRINRIGKAEGLECEILAKCEFVNPGGSVKDRIAIRMIEDAEAMGIMKPGDTLIEPTSGNTGIGLALAAAVKGYRCIIVMPEKMSKEKVDILKALGAEIVRTPTTAAFDSEESHIGVARRLQKELPRAHILDQYRNPSNPLAHYEGTAEEILEACQGKIDMFVAGTGTGGTLSGVAMKIKQHCPNCKIIGVDPLGSVIAEPEEQNKSELGLFEVEGIGYDFVPTVSNGEYIDQWIKSQDKPTFLMARRLIRDEGLLCGGSSGAAMHSAIQAAKKYKLGAGQRVVVILPDTIRNYMTRFLSDDWMLERRYIAPQESSDNRNSWWYNHTVSDLQLAVPVTIRSTVTVQDALQLMKEEGFDQAPVVDDHGDVIGMVTLGNTISLLTKDKIKLDDPVTNIIYKQFRKVTLDTKLGNLSVALNLDHYVVVVHDQREYSGNNAVATKSVVYGIATRVNLLDYVARGEEAAANKRSGSSSDSSDPESSPKSRCPVKHSNGWKEAK